MGVLIRFTAEIFPAVWEGWQVAAGDKAVGITAIRRAGAIDVKLEKASSQVESETQMTCPHCDATIRVADAPHLNWWRILTARKLDNISSDGITAIFFENEEFVLFKDAMSGLKVPQPRLKLFVQFWDLMDDADKNWRGDEISLRQKLVEKQP